MKKVFLTTLSFLFLFQTVSAQYEFTSRQLSSTTRSNGYVLTTDGVWNKWMATSSLGISGGASLTGGSPNTLTYWTSGSAVSATGSPTVGYITATSTTASLLPYASSTALTLTGSLFAGANSPGTLGQYLMSTVSGIKWVASTTLATLSSALTGGQLLYTQGINITSVATGTLGATGPITVSAGTSVVGGAATIACTTAASGVAGCLSNTSFDTFNNKQATISATFPINLTGTVLSFGGLTTSTAATLGNIPYFTGQNTFGNVATTTVSCSGTASCTQFVAIGGSPITITGAAGTSASSTLYVDNNNFTGINTFTNATTSKLTLNGNVFDTNKSLGTQGFVLMATSTGVQWVSTSSINNGVTSVTGTGEITSSGGATPAISFSGISTSSTPSASGVLYAVDAIRKVATVATSSETCSSPLSCGAHDVLKGGGAISCATASAGVAGCLNSSDWSTFNGKQATLSTPTWPIVLTGTTLSYGGLSTSSALSSGQIIYSTGVNTVASAATSSETCTSPLSCGAHDVLKGGGAISLGTVGIGNGGTNSTSLIPRMLTWFDGTSITSTSSVVTVGSIVGTTTSTSTFAGDILTTAIRTTATSTLGAGFNITAGCYSINNVCVTGGGGASLSGGSPNTMTYWTSGSTVGATSSPTVDAIYATSTATSTFIGGITVNILNTSSTTASSTFANGINLKAGCFAINNTCSQPYSARLADLAALAVTLGMLIYANGTNLVGLSGNTTTTKKFLTQTGDGVNSAAPGWNTIVSSDVPDDIIIKYQSFN